LRAVLGSGFFDANKPALEAAMQRRELCYLGMLLCQDMSQMIYRLPQLQVTTNDVPVPPVFVEQLIEFSKKALEFRFENRSLVKQFWDDMFTILPFLKWSIANEILGELVPLCSFRSSASFAGYLDLIDASSKASRLSDMTAELLDKLLIHSVCRDLESNLPIDEYLSLIRSPQFVAGLLSKRNVLIGVQKAARSIVQRQSSFAGKLEFASELYMALPVDTIRFRIRNSTILLLVDDAVRSEKDFKTLFRTLLGVVDKNPNMFETGESEFVASLCECLIHEDDGPTLLAEALLLDGRLRGDAAIGFRRELEDRVRFVLCRAAKSIAHAATFYLEVSKLLDGAASRKADPNPFRDTALFVFEKTFSSKWRLSGIEDVVAQEPETLDILFSCFQVEPRLLEHYRERIAALVAKWCADFQADALNGRSLSRGLDMSKSKSWKTLQVGGGYPLPSTDPIEEKLTETTKLMNLMEKLLSAPDGSLITHLLEKYNCTPKPSSPLDGLILAYGTLFDLDRESDPLSSEIVVHVTQELRGLREDFAEAEEWRQKYDGDIMMCNYFLENPSALFSKHMMPFTKKGLHVSSLSEALKCATQKIRVLFSSETTFKDVDEAVKIVMSSGNTLDEELSVLTGCDALQLVREHQDRFHAVAMMSCFSEPLEQFVKFCRQFKFFVADSTDFSELAGISAELASGEVFGFDSVECMEFSERLYRMLCPDAATDATVSVLCDMAKRRLPGIGVLGALSSQSEIWSFVREMKWFGDDGLKRFYEEHGNVTNVLLGNTASYEMTVLDALEPVSSIVVSSRLPMSESGNR